MFLYMKCVLAMLPVVMFFASPSFAAKNDYSAVTVVLKKNYPSVAVDAVSKTDIDGLYEVASGSHVIYYHLKTNTLIVGEMVRGNRSLTAERRNEIAGKLIGSLPLDKAVKIGNGKNIVIEFSDPDCTFCRQADAYLAKWGDVTLYVFLYPLPMHREAPKKSLKVLCAKDGGAAYRDLMAGKMDAAFTLPEGCEDKAGNTLMEHIAWGQKLGVEGTPAFWVNGQRVEGANFRVLDALLAQGPKKGN